MQNVTRGTPILCHRTPNGLKSPMIILTPGFNINYDRHGAYESPQIFMDYNMNQGFISS